MKTAAGRAKKIAGFVEMSRRGETIYPAGAAAASKTLSTPARRPPRS